MSSTLASLPEIAPQAADRTRIGRARSLARGVMNTVRLSRALLESGREIDLAGLDAVVGLLCAKALDLSPEQGRMLVPELSAVLEEVDILRVALAEAEMRPPEP